MRNIGFGKLAVACYLSPIWGGILVAIFVGSGSAAYDFCINALMACFLLAHVFLILWVVTTKEERAAYRQQRKREREEYNSPENVAMRQEKAENDRRYRELCKKYEYERKYSQAGLSADHRAVSAVLISTMNRRSAVGTIARAAVGGAFFGIAGTVGGAASGKSEATHATFSVKYASGRVATETVPINSSRFKELSALLHI